MTIEKGFEKIFEKSFNLVDSDLFGIEQLSDLKDFNSDLFRTNFILEMIRFFMKEYEVDLMPMYLKYMSKCTRATYGKAADILEGMFE